MKFLWIAFLIILIVQEIYGNTEKVILQVRKQDELVCDAQLLSLSKYQSSVKLYAPYTEHQDSLIPKTVKDNKATASWYKLVDLKEGANYELRISYPAITPADFEMKLISRCQQGEGYDYVLQVTALYTGVSQIKGIEYQPIKYNIVLENLYVGVLFYQVYKIVIAILLTLLIGQFLFIPFIKNLIIQKAADKKSS